MSSSPFTLTLPAQHTLLLSVCLCSVAPHSRTVSKTDAVLTHFRDLLPVRLFVDNMIAHYDLPLLSGSAPYLRSELQKEVHDSDALYV